METSEITGTELAADPNTRQRLALTLTRDGIPPRVAEALLLQLVSVPVPAVDQQRRPLHVGFELDRRIPSTSVFTELRTVTDAVGLIHCEAADHTAAMYTNADKPVTDPQTPLTAYTGIRFAGPELQMAISQGMETGEIPVWKTDSTHSAPGAITVTWHANPTQHSDEYYDMIPQLAMALDVVVPANRRTDRWLNGTTTYQIDPVEPAFAGAYLNHARQQTPTLTTEAREYLATKDSSPEAARCVGADSAGASTQTVATDTVERLAIANARLKLSETVTSAHIEMAGQLYANMFHINQSA